MERITSQNNPKIKQLAKWISQKKARMQSGVFVAEGVRIVLDAANSGLIPKELYVTASAREKYSGEIVFLEGQAQQVYEISEEAAAKISDTSTPQGVFGVFPILDNRMQADTICGAGRYLVLCSLQDPGNIGTIIRSCEAFGVDRLFLTADCPDLYSPKVLRSTMGGVFRLPITIVEDARECISRLQREGISVYAAALQQGAQPIQKVDFSRGGAVVIGNEGNGLSQEIMDCCDGAVIIPMAGRAESLNASVAASIVAWEMSRQNTRG